MINAGTDPKYVGLFKSVAEWKPLTDAENASATDYPKINRVDDFTKHMVSIDDFFAKLKKSPDAPTALLFKEQFAESARRSGTIRDPKFQSLLKDALIAAEELEAAIGQNDPSKIQDSIAKSQKLCSQCHAAYRDEK